MSEGGLLITGADGYMGGLIARHYLLNSARALHLWVRAEGPGEFDEKRRRGDAALRRFAVQEGRGSAARVVWTWGDLREAAPFRRVDAAAVSDIVHAAAVTRFTVDAETARAVNTEGAEKLLRFTEDCPSLRGVGLLSTLYATGLHGGVQREAVCTDEAGFANHYEESKWRAEQLAVASAPFPRVSILRLATVLADGGDGRVSQYNAVHNTLKLFFYGLLSLMPGNPDTPLHFVTGDFATRAVAAVMDADDSRGVYHVTGSGTEPLRLATLVDLAFEEFARDPDFARRRVLPPLFADRESFETLVSGLSKVGGGAVNQALSSVAPFARQLFVRKDVRNDRLRALMPDHDETRPADLVARTCRQLVATRWGRHAAA